MPDRPIGHTAVQNEAPRLAYVDTYGGKYSDFRFEAGEYAVGTSHRDSGRRIMRDHPKSVYRELILSIGEGRQWLGACRLNTPARTTIRCKTSGEHLLTWSLHFDNAKQRQEAYRQTMMRCELSSVCGEKADATVSALFRLQS